MRPFFEVVAAQLLKRGMPAREVVRLIAESLFDYRKQRLEDCVEREIIREAKDLSGQLIDKYLDAHPDVRRAADDIRAVAVEHWKEGRYWKAGRK